MADPRPSGLGAALAQGTVVHLDTADRRPEPQGGGGGSAARLSYTPHPPLKIYKLPVIFAHSAPAAPLLQNPSKPQTATSMKHGLVLVLSWVHLVFPQNFSPPSLHYVEPRLSARSPKSWRGFLNA